MALEQEIRDAITKNLPAQVGKVLQEQLAELETAKVTIKQNEEALVRNNNTITAKEKELEFLRAALKKQEEIERREQEVSAKERNIEIINLTVQLDAEKRVTSYAWNFLNALVKNPTFVESVNKNIHTGTDYYNNTQSRYVQGESSTVERTVK